MNVAIEEFEREKPALVAIGKGKDNKGDDKDDIEQIITETRLGLVAHNAYVAMKVKMQVRAMKLHAPIHGQMLLRHKMYVKGVMFLYTRGRATGDGDRRPTSDGRLTWTDGHAFDVFLLYALDQTL